MKKEKMTNNKQLVIGAGEIGTSVYNVLNPHYNISIRDKEDDIDSKYDILHICYPPIDNFIEVTKEYIKQYDPSLVIVHSTVSPGTTRKIGDLAVHSPVRGVHPHLEEGIETFVKYFGGKKSKEAAKIFSDIDIKTKSFNKPETTELLKILSTTYYAWNVVFQKEVKRICDEHDLDFDDVYTTPNKDYNEGYKKLDMEHVTRPVLKHMPGPIGGHCLLPNCELLNDWLTETIKGRNKKYQE